MNMFKGLMFLHGHFVRPGDVDDGFAGLGNLAAAARFRAARPGTREAPAAAGEARTGPLRSLLPPGGPASRDPDPGGLHGRPLAANGQAASPAAGVDR